MQLALYRAERPEVFEDIIGQKHIVKILQNQIRTGTVSQAYLFAGTHGTGKTTTARILAKAVNCLEGEPGTESAEKEGGGTIPCGHCENCEAIREGRFVDVIELDAASNNGVDDLRAIIDMVKYPPSVGRYKVYIIDEVHMLSQAAENAFLKTLEEPPEHAIFILATTDPQKVRQTIRSRCMELNFRRVSEEELAAGMERICAKRGIEVTSDALITIASRADGSVRDALSILEQCMAAGDKKLDRGLVLEYTGAAGEDFYLALTGAVTAGDIGKSLVYIDEIIKRGKDARQILKDWLRHYRDLMIVKYVSKPGRMLGYSEENMGRLKAQADSMDLGSIERAIRLISEYINIGRYSERPRILLETVSVRLADGGAYDAGQSMARGNAGAAGGIGGSLGSAAGSSRGSLLRNADRASQAHGTGRNDNNTSRAAAAAGSGAHAAGENSAGRQISAGGADPANTAAAEYDEPIESIAAAPREVPGDPADMWFKITDAISAGDRSFVSQLGRNASGSEYENGELIITVRPQKMRTANDRLGDISRAAKAIYGPDVFVTLREGEPEQAKRAAAVTQAQQEETARIIDEDVNVNDVVSDIQNLFGIKPEVTN
ncbi:MAG: DNA polymerase III subunit gamma/tau [Mogibacterium sp.]|nr:DNA polymerase III subunit gamma/tau [Mogibacterium sp.]